MNTKKTDRSENRDDFVGVASALPAAPSSQLDTRNPHALALGSKGWSKGGHMRAANLTAERRREIAQKAAAKRWGKVDPNG